MPVKKCDNGKWQIGDGKCMYNTKADADKAYKAYLAKKHSENKEVKNLKNLYRDSLACFIDEAIESKDGVKKVKIRVVTEGITVMKDKYYTKDTLKQAVENGVFNNAPMFLNHTTVSEEFNRPERDINDKVAEIKTTEFKEKNDVGYIIGNTVIHGSPTYDAKSLFEWFKNMKESKTPIEVSQHSYLRGDEGEKNGYPLLIVDDIEAVKSVDFVTAANAGGFLETLESQKIQKEEGDEEIMNLDELKKKHPELVTQIKAEGKEGEQIVELKAEGEKKDERIKALETEAKENELNEKKESLVKEAEKLIDDSKLPDLSKDKLKKEINKDSITEETESLKKGTEEKITKEAEYLKGLSKKGVEVFGNGDGALEGGDDEPDMETKLEEIKDAKDSKKKDKK